MLTRLPELTRQGCRGDGILPRPAYLSTIPGALRAHLRKTGPQASSTSSPGIRLETWFLGATQTVGLGNSGAGLGPWPLGWTDEPKYLLLEENWVS